MDTTRKLKLNISILGKEHVLSVSRDVVRALGKPDYIRLLKNTAQHAVAIQACDEKELLSFKVPERLFEKGYSSGFRIYSFSFVDEIIGEYHLDYNSRCTFLRFRRRRRDNSPGVLLKSRHRAFSVSILNLSTLCHKSVLILIFLLTDLFLLTSLQLLG